MNFTTRKEFSKIAKFLDGSKNNFSQVHTPYEATQSIGFRPDGRLYDKIDYECIPRNIGGASGVHSETQKINFNSRKLIDLKDHFFTAYDMNSIEKLSHSHQNIHGRSGMVIS